ncbi:MAG: BTAD domain-containing putative transcriptional regulator [Gammaproteobacteria bacterium]|nr:BTAD domain-containing putative transcriptional regulator [Gammaproteobacteria bacterium]
MTIERDRLALNPGEVTVDALEFENAGSADDLASLRLAEKLYSGRFLEGFSCETEEFQAWQATEAMRLEDLALQVFSRLADRALQAGKATEALNTSLRMLELDPLHEHACRLQMRALAASGRRVEAMRRFDAFAGMLYAELQTAPEDQTTELHERIRQGRAVAPDSTPQEPEVPSIVVLPVHNNSGHEDHDLFCDALTETLTAELSRDRSLFVIARNSAEVYRDTALSASEIAADLGIRYLLLGSMQIVDQRLRVNVQLVQGSNGRNLWAERYDRPLTELFEVQDEIVSRIVASLRGYKGVLQRAELKKSLSRRGTELSTYEKLMRGMAHKEKFLREDMLIARDYFEQAVTESPDFAMAHAWLAWTWFFDVYMAWVEDTGNSLQKTFEYARESIRLDPSLDSAHWALGAAHLAAGDLAASLLSFDEALRLNPNNSDALANRAWPLTFAGRADEAVRNIESAMRLNPYYPHWYLWGLGIAEYSRGEFRNAVQALAKMRQPNAQSLAYLAAARFRTGESSGADEAVSELIRLDPGVTITKLMQSLPYTRENVTEQLTRDLAELGLAQGVQKNG